MNKLRLYFSFLWNLPYNVWNWFFGLFGWRYFLITVQFYKYPVIKTHGKKVKGKAPVFSFQKMINYRTKNPFVVKADIEKSLKEAYPKQDLFEISNILKVTPRQYKYYTFNQEIQDTTV